MGGDARSWAVDVLGRTEKGALAQKVLGQSIKADVREEDRKLVWELVLGVIRHKALLDWVIGQKAVLPKSAAILNVLRTALFQKIFLEKIPDYALVNEGVDLARRYGGEKQARFVNALLRGILRRGVFFPERADSLSEYLSVLHSHPVWLVEKWLSEFGEKETTALLRFNNERPPFTFRVNTLKISSAELFRGLKEEGFKTRRTSFAPDGLQAEKGGDLLAHPFFRKGYFFPQDESAILVGHYFPYYGKGLIVDWCGAPGGKATHLASLRGDKGEILVCDVSSTRLDMVRENTKRLGIGSVRTRLKKAGEKFRIRPKAEGILVDAPCSNLGVIRRRPEVKWRARPGDLLKFQKKQVALLREAAANLRNGGRIVYSTCSLAREENEEVIRMFLEENGDFSVDKSVPEFLKGFQGPDGFIRLYPFSRDMDKFFMAKLSLRE